jgi:RimJ/RimL family protein N-acetyltransferase
MAIVLQTDRLILRPHTAADFPGSFKLWTDPDVVRFISGRPSTEEEVWFRLLRYAGLWGLLGYGYFLAIERGTGAVVGDFGIAEFRRDITPSFGDAPEAGWIMTPEHHGKGLAREAMTAILDWADQSWPRTVCMISPENTASVRLAERLGYRQYGQTQFKGDPVTLFERPSPLPFGERSARSAG